VGLGPPADGFPAPTAPAVPQTGRELRRELGLFDLVLAQILVVVVADYMGTAVKAGRAHVVFWLVGIVLFFVPLALVVIHLNRLLPLEGGLYEWARIAFNDQIGFLVAWNLWMYAILYVGIAGFVTVSFASYVIPGAAWMAASKPMLIGTSCVVIAATMLIAGLGLGIGKWVSNIASLAFVFTMLLLIVNPWLSLAHGTLKEYHPLALVLPPVSLFSLSVFSKMTFGALTGFEYVAVLAGECRNPRRDLPRSVLLAAPVIAVLYILATSSILAFVPSTGGDVVAPVIQALSRGAEAFGIPGIIVPVAVVFLLIYYLATFCVFFGVSTRLPMVAGWDHLLPPWFSRLHPRYKTPVNSILFLGGATLAVGLGASVGVGHQEAFELLITWSFTFYGLAYLAMFAIPLFSLRKRGLRPGLWLRAAAVPGFLTTLLFVVLSIFPVITLANPWRYSLKIASVVVGANLLAGMVYYAGRGKRSLAAEIPTRAH
jgi:amino acid transporter